MKAVTKPTYATAAATALRKTIAASHTPLRDAVTAYRAAWAALAPDADLLDVLRAAGTIVLAAEEIAAAGKQAEATARTALASCMAGHGVSRPRARFSHRTSEHQARARRHRGRASDRA